jgi:hypothetical protein
MRLAHRRVDSVAKYSTDIRSYLEEHNGRPNRRYRETYDPEFDEAGTQPIDSLWSTPAQVAIQDSQANRRGLRQRDR